MNSKPQSGQKFGQPIVQQTPVYDRKIKVLRPRKRPNNIKGGGGVRWI